MTVKSKDKSQQHLNRLKDERTLSPHILQQKKAVESGMKKSMKAPKS